MVAAAAPPAPSVAPPRTASARPSLLLATSDLTIIPRFPTSPDGKEPWFAASRRVHEKTMAINAMRDAEKAKEDAFAAVKRGDLALLKQRLKEGVNVNARNEHGETLAICAAKRQDQHALLALAYAECDGGIKDPKGLDAVAHAGVGECLWLAAITGGNPFRYRGIDRLLKRVTEVGTWYQMGRFALNAAHADYEDAKYHGRLLGLINTTLGPEAPKKWREADPERKQKWRRQIAHVVAGRAWPEAWRSQYAALIRSRCEDAVEAAILIGDLGLAGLVSEVAPE